MLPLETPTPLFLAGLLLPLRRLAAGAVVGSVLLLSRLAASVLLHSRLAAWLMRHSRSRRRNLSNELLLLLLKQTKSQKSQKCHHRWLLGIRGAPLSGGFSPLTGG